MIPDHPITIEPARARVVVRFEGEIVADSTRALVLCEAGFPPVTYIPLDDVRPQALEASDTTTYCPFKGDAAYYSITAGGAVAADAVWTYPEPRETVAGIVGHVAFYPDRVEVSGG